METVSIKFEPSFLKAMESKMKKHRYSTKAEFIREAIRDKLEELEKKEALLRLRNISGASIRKTTDKQLHEAGEKAFPGYALL